MALLTCYGQQGAHRTCCLQRYQQLKYTLVKNCTNMSGQDLQLSMVNFDITKAAGLLTLYTCAGEFRTLTFVYVPDILIFIIG